MPSPRPPSPPPSPSSDRPSLSQPAALHFATDGLPWQRSLRWSEPPRDRRLLWLGGLFALLITLAELGGFAIAMRDFRALRPRPSPPIQVSLIVPFEQLPPPPPEPEPPIVARSSRIAIAPPEVKTTPPPPRPTGRSNRGKCASPRHSGHHTNWCNPCFT